MFLRFPARFSAYIYASMHMQACARAEKACKDTTNFSYGKIFWQKNVIFRDFSRFCTINLAKTCLYGVVKFYWTKVRACPELHFAKLF